MKRIFAFFVLLICGLINAFSDVAYNIRTTGYYELTDRNTTYTGTAMGFTDQGKVTMYQRNNREWIGVNEGIYNISNENIVSFIDILWDNNRQDKYLFLFYGDNSIIMLYDNDSEPIFIGFWTPDANSDERFYMSDPFAEANITATSSLREGNIVYSPNISNLSIGRPWVEGVDGYGIGEKLILHDLSPGVSGLYISIGFVSFNRPHLYAFNSRPSRIRVTYNNMSLIFDLDDVPHYQFFHLPEAATWETLTVEIEILEVYSGTRWDDTCINSILYYQSSMQ